MGGVRWGKDDHCINYLANDDDDLLFKFSDSGIHLQDDIKLHFGDGDDQTIYGDGTDLIWTGTMKSGTYGSPNLSTAAGETFWQLWCKCSGAGHVYGMRVSTQVSNVAATTSNAIRAELDYTHTSGNAVGGGSAIHAAVDIGSTNTGHAGLLTGLNAAFIVPTGTRTMQGTYAALSLQSQIATGATMPALTTAFIYAADAGAVKAPAFLYWGQAEAASTGVVAKAVTGGAAAMSIAVNINGTMGYIPIHAAVA